MSKKVYALIDALIGAVATASVALVTFFEPLHASAINGSIELITTAVISALGLFLDKTDKKTEDKLEK